MQKGALTFLHRAKRLIPFKNPDVINQKFSSIIKKWAGRKSTSVVGGLDLMSISDHLKEHNVSYLPWDSNFGDICCSFNALDSLNLNSKCHQIRYPKADNGDCVLLRWPKSTSDPDHLRQMHLFSPCKKVYAPFCTVKKGASVVGGLDLVLVSDHFTTHNLSYLPWDNKFDDICCTFIALNRH